MKLQSQVINVTLDLGGLVLHAIFMLITKVTFPMMVPL